MRLLQLVIRNFKTVTTRQDIDFASRGLILVTGINKDDPSTNSNGAGKTTIADALVWCLYGQTVAGATGDDVVNETEGRECMVAVTFESHGATWTVARYRKDSAYKNRIFCNDITNRIDRTQHLNDDTQREVERVVGLDYKAFMTAVVFGQGYLAPFSKMKPKEQAEIMDAITGLDVLEKALEVVRERKRDHRSEMQAMHDGLQRATDAHEEAQRELAEAKQEERIEQQEHVHRLAQLQEAVETAQAEYDAAIKLENEQEELKEKIATAEKRLDKAREEREEHRLTCAAHRSSLNPVTQTLKRYQNKTAGIECNECGGQVSRANLTRVIEKHTEEKQRLSLLIKNMERLIEEAEAEVERRKAKVKALRDKVVPVDVARAKRDLRSAKEAVDQYSKTTNPYVAIVKKWKDKVTTLSSEMKRLMALGEEQLQEHKYIEWCEEEYNTKIRLDVQDTVLPFLNETARRYSDIITDGNVMVQFSTSKVNKSGTVKDTFTVTADNAHGSKSYDLQSRGEKQKIDLIVASTLQALSMEMAHANVNLSIMDEIFDGLDDEAIQRVITFLQDELKRRESVFVITHRDSLKTYFSDHLTAVKHNGQTVYETA